MDYKSRDTAKTIIKIFIIVNLFLLCIFFFDGNYHKAEAAVSRYVKNSNFVGSYSATGKKPKAKNGWYGMRVRNIKKGKITFQIDKGGLNGSPLYMTKIVKAKIKKNKASFKWTDTWGNKGKGTIILKKKHKIVLSMKTTKSSGYNRSSLNCKKLKLKRFSKKKPQLSNW